jgi:hypothetical protein
VCAADCDGGSTAVHPVATTYNPANHVQVCCGMPLSPSIALASP